MSLTPYSSQLIADVGISMGDEGKGRLVYEVIEELKESTGEPSPVEIVIKVNGGANSGHTAGGLKLNLLPAGVIDQSVKTLAIGCGVVADPRKFHWEAQPLEKRGYTIYDRLAIDERTLVSDLAHRLLDLAWEHYRIHIIGEEARGSTGRGITPSYQDETGQWQIYYADFRGDKDTYSKKLTQRLNRALATIQHVCQVTPQAWDSFFDTLTQAEQRANKEHVEAGIFEEREFDFHRFKGDAPFTLNMQAVIDAYWEAGSALANSVCDVRDVCLDTLGRGKYILGEFGQSYWLDKRHGFPPNVTASHTFTPEFFQSAGVPAQPVHTLGCCKAYDTKVGTHLFLTQFPEGHALGERLKKLEFGTSTGRQRMVGWFDAVEKGDALRYGGYQDLVVNKLDALSYGGDWQGGELLICTAYRAPDGTILRQVPRDDRLRKELKPVYLQLPGWKEDISKVRKFNDLPEAAKKYIATLVKAVLCVANRSEDTFTTCPNLRYIGVGPDPSQIIRDIPDTQTLIKLAR